MKKLLTAGVFSTALFLASAALQANAEPVFDIPTGTTYTLSQLNALSINGLKIGMTEQEALAALKAAGFEGKFAPVEDFMVETNPTESQVSGFNKPDISIYPTRYLAKDGIIRIGVIKYVQHFDEAQDVGIVLKKVVAKYGTPTEGSTYYADGLMVSYHQPKVAVNKGTGIGDIFAQDQDDGIRGPTLVAVSQPHDLVVVLGDDDNLRANFEARKAAAAAQAADKAKNAAQGTNLGL